MILEVPLTDWFMNYGHSYSVFLPSTAVMQTVAAAVAVMHMYLVLRI